MCGGGGAGKGGMDALIHVSSECVPWSLSRPIVVISSVHLDSLFFFFFLSSSRAHAPGPFPLIIIFMYSAAKWDTGNRPIHSFFEGGGVICQTPPKHDGVQMTNG